MEQKSRRQFLSTSARLIAGTAAVSSVGAYAASHGGHGKHHHGSADGMSIDAAAKDTCGTCQYWGGMRKRSEDGKTVHVQSMGWCNNPDSKNYRKLTSADHKMKKPGIWKKWPAL